MMVASVVVPVALMTFPDTKVDSVDSEDHVEELVVLLEVDDDHAVDSEDRHLVQSCSLSVVPKSMSTK